MKTELNKKELLILDLLMDMAIEIISDWEGEENKETDRTFDGEELMALHDKLGFYCNEMTREGIKEIKNIDIDSFFGQ